jgi:hypothetical protein
LWFDWNLCRVLQPMQLQPLSECNQALYGSVWTHLQTYKPEIMMVTIAQVLLTENKLIEVWTTCM